MLWSTSLLMIEGSKSMARLSTRSKPAKRVRSHFDGTHVDPRRSSRRSDVHPDRVHDDGRLIHAQFAIDSDSSFVARRMRKAFKPDGVR